MNASTPSIGHSAITAVAGANPTVAPRKRHAAFVRVTHWLATVALLALLVSGCEIILSHPRFYWGETGNVNMKPWLNLHLPSSRGSVPTGYGYVLPDQNGWSRYLHFQAAWLAVITGFFYVVVGLFRGHFRRNLLPTRADVTPKHLFSSLVSHLRFAPPAKEEAWSYNVLQRLTYLLVVFALVPFLIWTGLAMSYAFTSAFPFVVETLGGHQSARSLHFLATILFILFLFIHILMVVLAGFRDRMQAMVTGNAKE